MSNAKFNTTELASNVIASYAGNSLMDGNLNLTASKQRDAVRIAIANASWQGGWMTPQVQQFLNSLGIKDVSAVQAVYQGLALQAMGYVMGGRGSLVNDVIQGAVATYGGQAIASNMPRM